MAVAPLKKVQQKIEPRPTLLTNKKQQLEGGHKTLTITKFNNNNFNKFPTIKNSPPPRGEKELRQKNSASSLPWY